MLKLLKSNMIIYSMIVLCLIIYVSITQLSKASLYGIFNIFTVNFNDHLDENVNNKNNRNETNENLKFLENILKYENELMNNKLNIYFVQTSENEDILYRHACSIESAARLHRNSLIFILMRSQYINKRKKSSFNFLYLYKNIRFVHFNENDIYISTTLSELNQTKSKEFIHYFAISHLSDLIRTAILYKYGGIYFDLDVIPIKRFSFFSNTIGLESNDGVNVAVLIFEKQHLVLDIQMDIQLKLIQKQFYGLCWNCIGPLALSNALKSICDNNQLHINNKDKCHNIDIQPSFVFYPIDYQKIPQFFRYSKSSNEIDNIINNSSIYSIHYFHHMTMNLPIENLSPFARIAQIYCPNISKQLIHHKEFLVKETTKTSKSYLFTNTTISFLGILILLLAAIFLSYSTSIRVFLFTLRQKFCLLW